MIKTLSRLVLVAMIGLQLAACSTAQMEKFHAAGATVGQVFSAVSTKAITPKAMVLARNGFNGVEAVATNYQRLPRCDGTNGPMCRDPDLREPIDDAVHAGRDARKQLASYMRTNPGSPGPQDIYNGLVTATETINRLTAAYRAAGGK